MFNNDYIISKFIQNATFMIVIMITDIIFVLSVFCCCYHYKFCMYNLIALKPICISLYFCVFLFVYPFWIFIKPCLNCPSNKDFFLKLINNFKSFLYKKMFFKFILNDWEIKKKKNEIIFIFLNFLLRKCIPPQIDANWDDFLWMVTDSMKMALVFIFILEIYIHSLFIQRLDEKCSEYHRYIPHFS